MSWLVRAGTASCIILLAACVQEPAGSPPAGEGSAAPAPVVASLPPAAETAPAEPEPPKDFLAWVEAFKAEAKTKNIAEKTVDLTMAKAKFLPRVIELDRKQPEFTLTFDQYLTRVANDARAAKGREKVKQHRALLEEVSKKFGVPPQYVVALWGIETDFGRVSGGFPVVSALATLAYEGRRAAYFRGELIEALKIIDAGHTKADTMIGSWAGAMGQNQFMPSSFQRFAVDYNNDGRKDIWGTVEDVMASSANYLSQSGWNKDLTWGRQVKLPADFDAGLAGLDKTKNLKEWQGLGVRAADGKDLPDRPLSASLILPEGAKGRAYLVYENFRVILKWNRSNFFALGVCHLADRIGSK